MKLQCKENLKCNVENHDFEINEENKDEDDDPDLKPHSQE